MPIGKASLSPKGLGKCRINNCGQVIRLNSADAGFYDY